MRKKVVEKKKVEVEKDVVISDTLHCNVCDKEIKHGYWMLYTRGEFPKDICSKKCLTHELDEYVKHESAGAAFEAYYMAGEEKKPEGGPEPK